MASLLLALLLPAVQSAREAARRASCLNNLKQLGISINSYISSHNSFPPALIAFKNNRQQYFGYYSVQVRLLPYLEKDNLYNGINFIVGTWPIDGYNTEPPPDMYYAISTNLTIANISISQFVCPSDGVGDGGMHGCNYRGNAGVGPGLSTWAETPDSGNGLFPEGQTILLSQVPDGFSFTVGFSERLRGSGNTILNPQRDFFQRKGIANTADQILLACRISARPKASGFPSAGQYWFWTGREQTLYTHAQSPNGSIPDCTYGGMTPALDMATARSNHPGGVNTMMADGSVRFFGESMHNDVWRAFGTRNGSELVE